MYYAYSRLLKFLRNGVAHAHHISRRVIAPQFKIARIPALIHKLIALCGMGVKNKNRWRALIGNIEITLAV